MSFFVVVEIIQHIFIFSFDPATHLRGFDELKNKLREELKHELAAISGVSDAAGAGKPGRRPGSSGKSADTKKAPDETDYFELVYECIDTRNNFLNIISLNSRSPVEPDIDLVILQALLNGKLES